MPPAPGQAQGSGQGRAAGLQCAHAVGGADQGQADRASVRSDVGGRARPSVVEGDDVAEGLAHGAGADAGGLGDARSALSMRLVTVVLGVVAGVRVGGGAGQRRALVMLPLHGGDLQSRSGCRRHSCANCQGHSQGRAAGLQCAHAGRWR